MVNQQRLCASIDTVEVEIRRCKAKGVNEMYSEYQPTLNDRDQLIQKLSKEGIIVEIDYRPDMNNSQELWFLIH